MKIITPPEYNTNNKGLYTISAVNGMFTVKRKKDVVNYFFRLQNQSNDYLKSLLLISSELEYLTSLNLKTIDYHTISVICALRFDFYERLKYLTFFDWVISLYKMNALYRMTNSLLNIAKHLQSKKHIKQLVEMEYQFNTQKLFFLKSNKLTVQFNPQTNYHYAKQIN